jgi:copper chaperone CopZ
MRTVARFGLFLCLLLLPLAASAGDAASAGTAAGPENVYVLGIEGMSCAMSCPDAVKQSISGLSGVRDVQVDFETKRATVRTDPGVELTKDQVDKSFHNQGYFVSSLEVKKPD